jgi:hypothetical protein
MEGQGDTGPTCMAGSIARRPMDLRIIYMDPKGPSSPL